MKTDYYLPFGPEIKLGQPFGARPGLYPNPSGGHNGDDWRTPIGVPVRAAGDGVVVFAGQFDSTWRDNFGWNINYGGNMVVINMDGKYEPYFEYAHLSEILVKVGDRVKGGQIIAKSGNSDGGTNVSTGPHCHVGCLPWNFNLNTNTYGRVNPRIYMTRHYSPVKEAEAILKEEEEDEMYVIARDPAAADPNATYIGNGIQRRHIPDPPTLQAIQKMAGWGVLNVFKNGEVQALPTAALGADVATEVVDRVFNTNIPRQGSGAAIGPNTNLGAVVAWFDSNILGILDSVKTTAVENGASVDETIEALKVALVDGIKIDVTASVK